MTRDYITLAADYQAHVIDGTIPACKWVKLACERNRRDLDRQGTPEFPYTFDPKAARAICLHAELLPHIKGPEAKILGQNEQGQAIWNPIRLEPWQAWLLTTLFGWRQADGRRRFRVALSLIPRKNAKSTLAAIIVLYMLVCDGEAGAECYSAATTRDQAKVIAEIAWEMARRSWAFRECFGLRIGAKTTRVLEQPASASKFAPLSADAHSLDGLNVSFAAVDEFHAHRTRAVYDVLDTATGTRAQPLLFLITTAGVEIGGICHEKLLYLEQLLEGRIEDETFFGINYTTDPGDDIRDPIIQRKANPNYGVSVQPADLERKIREAQHSPAALNNVLTKHFNIWIRTESAWLTADQWRSCAVPGLSLEQLRRFPCWIGVDLAEVRDLAALVAVFKTGAESWAMLGRYYLPQATIQRSPIAQLAGWAHDGHIIETEGDHHDYRRLHADLIAWCAQLQVQEIDFDRAMAAMMMQDLKAHFEPTLGTEGADRFVIEVKQNRAEISPAMKAIDALTLGRQLQHDGNPAMLWMITNVVADRNYQDELYPHKAGGKDSWNKIDGPMALFTAMSQALKARAPLVRAQMAFYRESH